LDCIVSSFGYLADHTDSNLTPGPLFEVKMELVESEMLFDPPLDFAQQTSFLNVVEDVLLDIITIGTLVDRVKNGQTSNYAVRYYIDHLYLKD